MDSSRSSDLHHFQTEPTFNFSSDCHFCHIFDVSRTPPFSLNREKLRWDKRGERQVQKTFCRLLIFRSISWTFVNTIQFKCKYWNPYLASTQSIYDTCLVSPIDFFYCMVMSDVCFYLLLRLGWLSFFSPPPLLSLLRYVLHREQAVVMNL